MGKELKKNGWMYVYSWITFFIAEIITTLEFNKTLKMKKTAYFLSTTTKIWISHISANFVLTFVLDFVFFKDVCTENNFEWWKYCPTKDRGKILLQDSYREERTGHLEKSGDLQRVHFGYAIEYHLVHGYEENITGQGNNSMKKKLEETVSGAHRGMGILIVSTVRLEKFIVL